MLSYGVFEKNKPMPHLGMGWSCGRKLANKYFRDQSYNSFMIVFNGPIPASFLLIFFFFHMIQIKIIW